MIREFFRGSAGVFRGIALFYGDRSSWKYALLPTLLLTGAYILILLLSFHLFSKLADYTVSLLPQMPDIIAALISFTVVLLGLISTLLIIVTTFCFLYEFCGGFFYDALALHTEKKHLGTVPETPPLRRQLFFSWEAFKFALVSGLIFLFLLVLAFFLPLAGQIIIVTVMGPRLALSSMFSAGFNNNCGVGEMRKFCSVRDPETAGFGMTAYLLLLIPFATPFILPGLITGGTLLFKSRQLRTMGLR